MYKNLYCLWHANGENYGLYRKRSEQGLLCALRKLPAWQKYFT